MSRRAILIEASKIKDHGDLPGARADVANYKAFLESAIGGAWNDNEITVLSHPARKSLLEWIAYARSQDYAFVTFSGHGHHVRGKDIDETRLCINDSEEVAVHDLNPGNPRSLIVTDSCRGLTILEAEEYSRSFQLSLNAKMAALRPDRARCRALFDASLEQAERGPIFMYSCDLNEAAGESNRGGYFSRAMLDVAEAWADQKERGTLRSNNAFAGAAQVTTRKNPQQHPVSEAGRRNVHFPFSVFSY